MSALRNLLPIAAATVCGVGTAVYALQPAFERQRQERRAEKQILKDDPTKSSSDVKPATAGETPAVTVIPTESKQQGRTTSK